MKTEEMKILISDYINEEPFDLDISGAVIKRIKKSNYKSRYFNKRVILIAVLILLLSTVTFATVLKVIELKTGNSDIVKEIKIISNNQEVDDINIFEGFSESDIPENLIGLPSMTINTEYPTRGITRRGNYVTSNYNELITSVSNTQLLPRNIDEYEFQTAFVGYYVIMPTDEELTGIANEHQDAQFYTFELETNGLVIDWYEYAHKSQSDAIYAIQPTKYSGSRVFQEEQIPEYEVVQLKTTEAFLMNRDNMDFSSSSDELSKDMIENNYRILWQEEVYEYSIRPSRSTRIYPDVTNRKVYSYPEDVKENLIKLAIKINELLNE